MNTFAPEQNVELGILNLTKQFHRLLRLSMPKVIAAALSFAFFTATGYGQSPMLPSVNDETQTPTPGAGHDYQHLLGETVNYSNGSIDFRISFPVPKSRGITLPYYWSYNSGSVTPLTFIPGIGSVPEWNDYSEEAPNTALDGWNTAGGIPSATTSVWTYTPPSAVPNSDGQSGPWDGCNFQSGMTFTDSSRVTHNLYTYAQAPTAIGSGYVGYPCGGQSPNPVYYAPPNGDGQVLGIPDPNTGNNLAGNAPTAGNFVVMDKSGTTYSFSGNGIGPQSGNSAPVLESIEDKNGNVISFPGTGSSLWTDSAGRPGPAITSNKTITTTMLLDIPQNGVETTLTPTYSSSLPSTMTVNNMTYTASWGTTSVGYTISLGTTDPSGTTLSTGCVGTIPTTIGGTRAVLNSLALPNGQKYTMYYGNNNPTDSTILNSYGLINEIIYPDGGWVKYTWQLPVGQNEMASWTAVQINEDKDNGSFYNTPADGACSALYQTPVLATRTVSFDGTTIAQSQSFSFTTSWPVVDGFINGWGQKTTTVTTTDNTVAQTSKTVYTYTPFGVPSQPLSGNSNAAQMPEESEIDYYDWGQSPTSSAPTGTTIKKVTKTWSVVNNSAPVIASESTTITATGQTAGTIYTYGVTPRSVSLDGFVNLIEQDDYDYGAGLLPVAGSSSTRKPSKKTFFNYTCCETYQLGQPYGTTVDPTPITVPDLLTSSVIESISPTTGTATIVAATEYGYDCYQSSTCAQPAGTLLAPSASAAEHGTNYGTTMLTRGNLTSVTRCTTLPTTATGSCSVGPTTYYNYDITGQPASMTDPKGNTTTFSFSDSPATGNSSYGNSNAYLTQITYPATNGVTHQENFQYNYQLGYLTESIDENSQVTSYTYNTPSANCASYGAKDGMDRLSQVTNPLKDGGITIYCYNDFDSPGPSVTTQTLINSSSNLWKVSKTTMDGMAHPVETQLLSDIDGTDTVTTTYDGEGHVFTVTNPEWGTPQTTDGTTTNYYDAFGRKIETVEPDGNITQTCYNGVSSIPAVSNCHTQLGSATTGTWVDSADEAGNDWQQTTDGLGRMTEVMEPNGTTTAPSMETDYPYDVLNNLLSVAQKGNTSVDTPRTTRSFTYNSLSQLVTSFNPESGMESYTYDLNGNLTSRTSPLVNSTTAGQTQTLGYCYDALSRVTYKFYTAPPSSCASPSGYVASFSYDTSSISGATNDIGRLTSESAYLSGTRISLRNPYQYDPMGRLTEEQQTPYSPNAAIYSFINTYDQAGDMTSTNNGFLAGVANGISTSYQYDGVQRLSLLTAGTNCTSPPACTPFAQTALFTANTTGSYGPAGITAATYGNGFSLARRYDNKLRVVDHQVYQTVATQASGSITISGALASGDSGNVKITLANVELSVPYSASANTTAAEIANSLIALINQSPEVIAVCPNTPCWAKVLAEPATTSGNSATIPLQAILEGTSGNLSITASATTSASFTVATSGSTLTGGSGSEEYYYQLAYNANGNIHSSNDSLNSSYGYYYDTLSRLTEVTGNGQGLTVAGNSYDFQCWAYDGFGNRTAEADTNNGCASFASTASNYTTATTYNSSNRVTSTTVNAAVGSYTYDVAGNVINDGVNQYVYDLDGRICAVKNILAGTMTQYVYDAEGRRVAKGTISAWPAAGATCIAPTAANGFTLTNQYLRGVSGDQDTELDGSGNWIHTNIYAGSGVQATYWNNAGTLELSYIFNDWLGTKRGQFSSTGSKQTSWQSDPFGDYMTAHGSGGDANEMHLTGKEHDNESGNDYFGARYYNSPMGRFMSPDWSAKAEPVPYAKLGNPQTLNLYAFVGNNPVSHVDVDGHTGAAYGLMMEAEGALSYHEQEQGAREAQVEAAQAYNDAGNSAAERQQQGNSGNAVTKPSNFSPPLLPYIARGTDDTRQAVLGILLAGGPCEHFFDNGLAGSAAQTFLTVSIRLTIDSPKIGAFTQEGGGAGGTIFVNKSGPFFNVSGLIDGKAKTLEVAHGYTGGFPATQKVMMLHEIGHLRNILPADGNNQHQSNDNTDWVIRSCSQELKK